jgi:hypothetical protein
MGRFLEFTGTCLFAFALVNLSQPLAAQPSSAPPRAPQPAASKDLAVQQVAPQHWARSGASGLYVRIDPDLVRQAGSFRTALSDPVVDGAAVMVRWSSIERKRGLYDWAILDPWIAKTSDLHKKLSIGVMAGWFTPTWLYNSGVPANRFRYNRNPQGQPACTVLTLPSPWSPVFLHAYNEMIVALAAHLRTFKGGRAFAALRMIKVGGINNTTEELRLVANRADSGPCQQSDAQTIWQVAGFRPSKIVSAWNAMAEAAAKAFPQALLSIDVIQSGAFPPIDEKGNIYRPPPRSTDALTDQIIEDGSCHWGRRLAVQWDALSQGPVNPAVLGAKRKGATIGWQLNHFVANGSGCIYGTVRKSCGSVAEFQTMLANGIVSGGSFVEIWANDVESYRPAFAYAHGELTNSP